MPPAVELDVQQNDEHLATLAERVRELAPRASTVSSTPSRTRRARVSARRSSTPWSDISNAMEISAYSYASLAKALLPVLNDNASIVGMDFDPSRAMPF
ncbi:SDR family oxidoreductase [Rhodococcus hoagii]|nr:SDR family oxidoreductase [Prescottella equi]